MFPSGFLLCNIFQQIFLIVKGKKDGCKNFLEKSSVNLFDKEERYTSFERRSNKKCQVLGLICRCRWGCKQRC